MRPLRLLIIVNVALLLVAGLFTLFLPGAHAAGRDLQRFDLAHLLAVALVGLAAVVLLQSQLSLTGELRQLALALSAADGVIFLRALFEQAASGGLAGWLLLLLPLALAAALAWMGWRPWRPAEIAAQIGTLKLPDEIRQSLLQQVGEAAAQEERNRLARDLHDSIKQQLFSINVGAAAAQERWEGDPEGARKALVDVRRCVREAMVEMQAMLHQLRPEALGTAGLIEALREQCEALGYRTGAKVVLELGEPIPDDRLPPGAQETLFRIGQEMLANVARHARARHVRLWLGRQEDWVTLQVEDDGQGFDPAAAAPGMGLRNLRERAVSLGGSLEIASTPAAGTQARVRVPLIPALVAGEILAEASGRVTRLTWAMSAMIFQGVMNAENYQSGKGFDLPHEVAVGTLVCLGTTVIWWMVRNALHRSPGAGLVAAARLRYLGYRGLALLFVAGAGLARQGSHTPGGWGSFWQLSGLLFLGLMGLEIFHAHSWSRPRRRPFEDWAWPRTWSWPPDARSTLLVGIALLAISVAFAPVFRPGREFWSSPDKLQFLALAAVVLIYFLWRRPLKEGDLA
jgi:signal transduction histidine kinase